jgi:hypothetical protein
MRVLSVVLAAGVWLPATVPAFETKDSRESLIETKMAVVAAAQAVRSARHDWEAAQELLVHAQLSVEIAELELENAKAPALAATRTLSSAREDWRRALRHLEAKASRLGRAEHLLRDAEEALNQTQLAQSSEAQ